MVDLKTQIKVYEQVTTQLVEIAWVTFAFATIMASNSGLDGINTSPKIISK
jgi:hypothetical protein